MRKLIAILAVTAAVLSVGYTGPDENTNVNCNGYQFSIFELAGEHLTITADREVLVDAPWYGLFTGSDSWPTVRPTHKLTIQIGDDIYAYAVRRCHKATGFR